ncbi:hypothetical protein ACLB2K_000938 [Fragaria x ananassa]
MCSVDTSAKSPPDDDDALLKIQLSRTHSLASRHQKLEHELKRMRDRVRVLGRDHELQPMKQRDLAGLHRERRRVSAIIRELYVIILGSIPPDWATLLSPVFPDPLIQTTIVVDH